jgi:hypothetical protein
MSDWIEWKGGECPVSDGTLVDVRFRGGCVPRRDRAGAWRWNLANENETPDADIVAYRLAETKAEPMKIDWYIEDEPKAESQAHMMSAPDMSQYAPVSNLMGLSMRAELDAKDAEIKSLRDRLAVTRSVMSKYEAEFSCLLDELEQLRKASDDKVRTSGAVGDVRSDVRVSVAQGILAVADPLDHRLGIAQPEGEPCEPRPLLRWLP